MPASLGGIASAFGTATSQTTGAITATPTAGSALVVVVEVTRDNSNAITVSDNNSNTFARVSGSATTTVQGTVVFLASNIATSAGHTVTVQFSDVNAVSNIAVQEIKGAATSSPFDVQAPTDTTNNQTPAPATTDGVTSTAATTTAAGEFVLGATRCGDAADLTVGTGFTNIQTVNNILKTEYLIQGAAGSIAATMTLGSAQNTRSLMATFKAASGAVADARKLVRTWI
jgi:hypothetical protein